MSELTNRNILLGVTGGIAAYKAAELIRRLRDAGASVQVVMTAGAREFITPLTLQALSGHPVHTDLLDPEAEAGMGHIELARWADLILIAPATADCLARLAAGRADDLLGAVCLASAAPLALAPAMNQQMWRDSGTQANVAVLEQRGVQLFGPGEGDQACGDVGPGRMLEPHELVTLARQQFHTRLLDGLRVVITAGPTREPLDPVRYLSNRSSGKMGFALAQAAVDAGAHTTLIAGPVNLTTPAHVKRIDVQTADEMHRAALAAAQQCDIFIAAAAVADYRPAAVAEQKIKKDAESIELTLVRNPDIVSDVAAGDPRPFTVGFAAETDRLLEYARDKMQRKKLNMIVANDVADRRIGFDSDDNAATVLWDNQQREFAPLAKRQLAAQLLNLIATVYGGR